MRGQLMPRRARYLAHPPTRGVLGRKLDWRSICMKEIRSPWLAGVPEAATYAHLGKDHMRVLVKSGAITSRQKPINPLTGKRPKGFLVYAPSIDAFLLEQPSGACEAASALQSVS